MELCGLIKKGASGEEFDKFRSRIIFPICNLTGQTIAFGGRIVDQVLRRRSQVQHALREGNLSWLILLALPLALLLARRFVNTTPGPAFNQILARTAQLQLAYGLLLCVALLL